MSEGMDKMVKERLSLAIIVSVLIIALFSDLSWIHLIPDVVRAMPKFLISTSVDLLLFPAVPIIYGWITKNEIGAILAGALPVIGFFILLPKFQSINNHRLSINKLCHYFQ